MRKLRLKNMTFTRSHGHWEQSQSRTQQHLPLQGFCCSAPPQPHPPRPGTVRELGKVWSVLTVVGEECQALSQKTAHQTQKLLGEPPELGGKKFFSWCSEGTQDLGQTAVRCSHLDEQGHLWAGCSWRAQCKGADYFWRPPWCNDKIGYFPSSHFILLIISEKSYELGK